MKLRGILESGALAVNVVLVCVLSLVVFRKGGPGYLAIAQWLETRSVHRELTSQWRAIASGQRRLDEGGGDVRLVEFADYQCPYCAQNHVEISRLLHDYPTVGIAFRHYPLATHRAARGAALASLCAEEQGRFRDMHARLFGDSRWQSDTNWSREAAAAGVPNLQRFSECLRDSSTERRLQADMALGRDLVVRGTPTFFSRSEGIRGLASESALVRLAHLSQ